MTEGTSGNAIGLGDAHDRECRIGLLCFRGLLGSPFRSSLATQLQVEQHGEMELGEWLVTRSCILMDLHLCPVELEVDAISALAVLDTETLHALFQSVSLSVTQWSRVLHHTHEKVAGFERPHLQNLRKCFHGKVLLSCVCALPSPSL